MLTRLRHRAHGQEGFTLIELLVVILIIGILAAVAIPAFLSQKGKGQDANVKSDINSAQTAEESYNTSSASSGYTAASSGSFTNLTGVEPTLKAAITGSEALTVQVTGETAAQALGATITNAAYLITATSPSGVKYALVKYTDGTVGRACDISGASNASGCNVVGAATQGSW
ncbi:MAG TPA: prepilin-type N-terminal cleavage/methylation domain-containing protein [Solirubrobacteraceae bacterium]|jgi:type IV pilus assembly protein PilA|nr:prepilin-type N-terminal cleavage/methylation domain-containing protein [Solirubrobacteraceae bacterium]